MKQTSEQMSIENLAKIEHREGDVHEALIFDHARKYYGTVNDDTIRSVWDDIYHYQEYVMGI
ncbi:hypothetical protein KAMFAM_289 [Bacillus phage Kamfam]|nr:hypothetical protein OTK52_287 [Bacillus phage OTooleKemple52]AXQ67068.1 hypothetical protein KAMFAM_289 [Bacillus phage Kamfam]